MRTWFCASFVITLLAAAGWAATGAGVARPVKTGPMHDTDFTPSLEYVSPHIPYAKPYAQGPVNALILAWACTGRSAVELHQRMDLRFDYVSAGENNLLWRGHPLKKPADDELGRVRELLAKPHDVIVLGAVPWGYYPDDIRAEILKQVEAGTGLVLSHDPSKMVAQADGRFFDLYQAAKPATATDYFPSDRARTAILGQGRIAFEEIKDPSPNEDFLKFFTGYYESGVEQFIRTLLWAARKEPKIRIEVAISREFSGPISVRLTNTGAAVQGRLRLDVRRDLARQYPMLYGSMYYQFRPYNSWEDLGRLEAEVALPAGDKQVMIQEPALVPGERQYTFALLDNAGKVLAYRNISDSLAGNAAITELRLGKEPAQLSRANEVPPTVCFTAQDTLYAQLVVLNPPPDVQFRLTLTDREGHVLASETKAQPQFQLPLHRALHRLLVAKAEMVQGNRVYAETRAPVILLERPERADAFRMRAYGCSILRPELTGFSISYRKGNGLSMIDAALQHAWHDETLGEFSSFIPMAKEITGDGARTPSFSDPAVRATQKEALVKMLQPAAPFGFNLLLCDEWTYSAAAKAETVTWPNMANEDTSEPAKAEYREFLKAQYKTLAALNAEWGTAHKGWEEIAPPVYDADSSKVPAEDAWPRIVDHRAFVEKSVADFIGELADAAHQLNPAINIGTSGHYSAGMWTGRDYYLWAKRGPHLVTYRDVPLWQSFTPQRVAAWIGYGGELKDPVKENYRAWKDLFEGIEKAYWGREAPEFAPDFTLLPAPAQYFGVKRLLRDCGIADMLVNAQGANQIAILCHPKSFTIANLKDWKANPAAYMARVLKLKYPGYLGDYMEKFPAGAYHWIHTDQIIRNDFGVYGKPTILLLPQTEVLADDEAAALRRYVEEGGLLVADLMPGLRDEHGKPRAKGALDDLFTPGAAKTAGKGKTLLLGALPKATDFARILEFAGLVPAWKTDPGTPAILVWAKDFRRGDHLYFGCTGDSKVAPDVLQKTQAVITLPAPMHVYDSIQGKYLGQVDKIPVDFAPGRMGAVFACLPYKVEAVKVSADKQADKLAFEARVAPAAAEKQIHTLRVQVFDPKGAEVKSYADRIETQNGSVRGEVYPALNDAPGDWRLVVTDVATGVKGETVFSVK